MFVTKPFQIGQSIPLFFSFASHEAYQYDQDATAKMVSSRDTCSAQAIQSVSCRLYR